MANNHRDAFGEDDIRGITCLYGEQICPEFQFATNPPFSKMKNIQILFRFSAYYIFPTLN